MRTTMIVTRLLIVSAVLSFAILRTSAAQSPEHAAQSAALADRIEFAIADTMPSFGQRFAFGLLGGYAAAIATRAAASENDRVAIVSAYYLGSVAGIGLVNQKYDGWNLGPTLVGTALGAFPLVLAAQGGPGVGVIFVAGSVTASLLGAAVYELID